MSFLDALGTLDFVCIRYINLLIFIELMYFKL